MAHQYIFVMKDLKKIVPPKREILKGIWLSFYPGAKIGVIGGNGAGKSTLLAHHGRGGQGVPRRGVARRRRARGLSAPGAPARPREGRARQRRGWRGGSSRPAHPLRRDQRQAGRAARRRRDGEGPGGTGPGAGRHRGRQWLGPRPHGRDRDGRPPLPARRRGRRHPVRRRGPAGGALPTAPPEARSPAPGRAHQPSRRGVGGLARAVPQGVPGHGGGDHPRPLLPRQRGGLDPRARPRRGHPVGGQLLLLARPEEAAPRDRGEAGDRAAAHARARARVGAHVAARAPGQVQVAAAGLRAAARGGRQRP